MAEKTGGKKKRYFHSVRLKEELCVGCTHCIRTCPNNAKYALTNPFKMLENFKYRVALPAPSFMSQFDPDDVALDKIYTALNLIGFQFVFEVAAAAELVNFATEEYLKKTKKKPVISSACPAVVRLI